MNTDISGIGVRISFYLQTIFLGENTQEFPLTAPSLTGHLACLSAKSQELPEITGALYTLIATNMAMAVASLILGTKPEPEISFHE
jgi:hypothetical protein